MIRIRSERKRLGNKSLLNGASLSGWEKVNRFSPDKNEAAAGLHISVTTSASVTKNKQTISHHHSARCLNNQFLKFTNILTWTKQHPRTPPTHAWDIYSFAQCHISPKLHWQCCLQLSLESAHLAIPNYQNRWTSWQIQKIFGPSVWYMCLNRISIKCASNSKRPWQYTPIISNISTVVASLPDCLPSWFRHKMLPRCVWNRAGLRPHGVVSNQSVTRVLNLGKDISCREQQVTSQKDDSLVSLRSSIQVHECCCIHSF